MRRRRRRRRRRRLILGALIAIASKVRFGGTVHYKGGRLIRAKLIRQLIRI
jgi:hypothetical protein